MTIDIEELERLEREATPGPWRQDAYYPQLVAGMASVPGGVPYFAPADAALIVAARNQLPALLARVRELEGQVRWFVEHAADQRLDGYRELGARAAAAENARDNAIRELRSLRAVAEAAGAFRRFHDGERPCGAALDGALDAWRGLR